MSRKTRQQLSVRFNDSCLSSVHTFDGVSSEDKGCIWYTKRDLQCLSAMESHLKQRRKKMIQDAALSGNPVIPVECGVFTDRGLERDDKRTDSQNYVQSVVLLYREQQSSHLDSHEDLRSVARSLSREERMRAREVGIKDAEAACETLDSPHHSLIANPDTSKPETLPGTMTRGLEMDQQPRAPRRAVAA